MIMSVTATGYVLAAERPPRQQSNWTQLTLIVGQQHTRAARFLTCANRSWTARIHEKHRSIFFFKTKNSWGQSSNKEESHSVFYNSQQRWRQGSNKQKNNDLKWPQNFPFFWLHTWVIVHLSLYKGILLCNCAFLMLKWISMNHWPKKFNRKYCDVILCNEKYVEVEVFKGQVSILITN